jgi:F-type H+-transporting ATPase subunit delta
MRGVSAESRVDIIRRVDAAIEGGADAARLGEELFAVASVLDGSPALRRAVTDPSASAEARSALLTNLLSGKVSDKAEEIVAAAAAHRWSASRHLADTLEQAGVAAVADAAERARQGDELEDELFRFGRLVAIERGLREALSDRTVAADRRQAFVRELVEGKASPAGVTLIAQAVAGRHRSVEAGLDDFGRLVAERRQRFVATVHTAAALTDTERGRLAAALERQYGRPVHLNVVVDPNVLGGVRVELSEDVIDGTVANKLDDARRRLAG